MILPRTVWKSQRHRLVADWLRLVEPTRGESCPSDNVEVPPHPGRTGSRPRIINPSISLQFQQPGDENGDFPGRYRPARCGNPNPTHRLLIGWGSWRQRAARVSPRANVEFAPLTRKIRSHPRIRNPSIPLQLRQPGDENGDPTGQYHPARCA